MCAAVPMTFDSTAPDNSERRLVELFGSDDADIFEVLESYETMLPLLHNRELRTDHKGTSWTRGRLFFRKLKCSSR